jgi:ABC-type glycerol-3-phosphate transport system permease component
MKLWLMRAKARNKALAAIVLIVYFAFNLFPIYWIFVTSLKTDAEVYTAKPTFIPKDPTFENYRTIYKTRSYMKYTTNTILISVGSTLTCVAFGPSRPTDFQDSSSRE